MAQKLLTKFKTRIQNPKVITAVISGILLVLVNLGIVDVKASHQIMDTANTVLTLLVGIGIFGNPESHTQKAETPQQ